MSCPWPGGRKKALCCTANNEIHPISCDANLCKTVSGIRCDEDPYAQDFSIPDEASEDSAALVERAGDRRDFKVEWIDNILGTTISLIILARGYPGVTHLHNPQRGANAVPAPDNSYR